MSQWQPIETAPSDIQILLYSPWSHATNPGRIETGIYHNSRGGSWHSWATHWMPLPAPPSEVMP